MQQLHAGTRPAAALLTGACCARAGQVAKRELALECDYSYEAAAQARFKALVAGDPQLAGAFHVPGVIPELSSSQVLTTEWVQGVAIDKVTHWLLTAARQLHHG